MQVLERKVLIGHQPGRAPIGGFVTYVSATEPVLLRRNGWEVGDDVHDDFFDRISHDNGQTWSEPVRSLQSTPVEGGHLIYVENAAIYLPQRNRLITFATQGVEPSLTHASGHHSSRIHITVRDPATADSGEIIVSDFGLKQGIVVSFCHPIEDSRGRILVPVQWQKIDTDGAMRAQGFPSRDDLPDVMLDVWAVGLLVGEFKEDGTLQWRLQGAIPCAFEKSSRGLCEGTVAELSGGRLVMILRGSNAAWPELPGRKWLSFSDDGGETWGEVQPLGFDDGSVPESSATGSALFRSEQSGQLYWIGNLCRPGERADGNMPRNPLVIAEVQEEPFALRRATLATIDQRAPHEDEQVQMSNFRFYQDRQNGEVVLFLTRYGERGSADGKWMEADHYQYRIALD